MEKKADFIKKILETPLEFSDQDFETMLSLKECEELTFRDIRYMISEIYDTNEENLSKISSEANKCILGKLNSLDTKNRYKIFIKRIKHFYKKNPEKKPGCIVAEGDSWFMFPKAVKDIIDWLNITLKEDYAIYSMAYGGDWITNIIYEGKFIEELSVMRPDFFLISGEGNDLVGSNKLAIMVNKDSNLKEKYPDEFQNGNYGEAENLITKEFFSFIITIKLQYFLMFSSISKSTKLEKMRIITQGYDYVIPDDRCHFSLRYPLQPLINFFIGNGGWLKFPLMIKGIPADQHQNIMRFMIDRVNMMFIELADLFPNVYHLDCRGVAKSHDDWFDELHLKSHVYKKVAFGYEYLINANKKKSVINNPHIKDKVLKVTDITAIS